MTGVLGILIKLGVRLVVFGAVFWLATRRNPKIVMRTRWATPVIALVFALLNTGLYWLVTRILSAATLGAFGFIMPFVVNALLLVATVKLFAKLRRAPAGGGEPRPPWFHIDGAFATLWLAGLLTLAHGAVWLAVDYLPGR